jgi:hypothetical protein
MTTLDEQRRTLVQVGAFLEEIRSNNALPEAMRREAHRLLRHYQPCLRSKCWPRQRAAPGAAAC